MRRVRATGAGARLLPLGAALAAVSARALPAVPDWTAEGNQPTAHFGYSVAAAGDVNGDGYSDLLVGARDYDAGDPNEGRAFVFHGGPSGPSAVADWTTEPDVFLAFLGQTVAPAGDVNGDGFADILVGAPNWGGTFPGEGRAYLFCGSDSGLADAPLWTREGGQSGATAGTGVGTAGDVNGDGYDDVLVGSRGWDGNFIGEGRVELFLGGPSGPDSVAVWTVEGGQDDAALGWSVLTAGDVNGDGYDDAIVGSFFYDGDLTDEGRASVYLGGPSGLAATPVWQIEGDQMDASLGWTVAPAGDVDGDGYADVIVGTRFYTGTLTEEGRASVYRGGPAGPDTVAAWTAEGGEARANFGWSVATAGDVNGDGYADVVIGAYRQDDFLTDAGQARVYLGSAAGLADSPVWTAGGGQNSAQFGWSVSGAGDVNGDGYTDVLVGANFWDNGQTDEGGAFLFLGGRGLPDSAAAWTGRGGPFGASWGAAVDYAGDVNGDGIGDVAVGDPLGGLGSGRVDVFLGRSGGPDTSPDWSEAGASGEALGRSLASAGDVDGDGYDDLIAGAPFHTGGAAAQGRAVLWAGSPIGLGVAPVWETFGAGASAFHGHAVASAGDVNGDGYGDVMVGAYQADGSVNDAGAVMIYHGGAGGLSTVPARTLEGLQSGGQFGWSVASAGDVNGDGFSDILIGQPAASLTAAEEGRAYLYLGSPSGVRTPPAWIAQSGQLGARFGESVASAGDVNGDGYSDALVVARLWDGALPDEGRASLYLGGPGGLSGGASWTVRSGQSAAEIATAVAAGDQDGDGYGDLLVGSPLYSGPASLAGRVVLYRGGPAGPDSAAALVWEGAGLAAQLGARIAGRGDADGDGAPDLLFGAPGYADSLPGVGTVTLHSARGAARSVRMLRGDGTTPVALRGRSDQQTGFGLEVTVQSPAGRLPVALEWAVAPLGAAFGAGVREAFTDPGAPVPGVGSRAVLTASPGGLSASRFYRWRTRVVTASPWFPATPWASHPAVSPAETHLRTAPAGVGAPVVAAGPRLGAAPSPFRERVLIAADLAPGAPLRVSIHDVAGRRLREWTRPAAPLRLTWDGTDRDGRPVPAGVYFVRVRGAEATLTRRIVRLR